MPITRRDFLKSVGAAFGGALALELESIPFVTSATERAAGLPEAHGDYAAAFERYLRYGYHALDEGEQWVLRTGQAPLRAGVGPYWPGEPDPAHANYVLPDDWARAMHAGVVGQSTLVQRTRVVDAPDRAPELEFEVRWPQAARQAIPLHALHLPIAVALSALYDESFDFKIEFLEGYANVMAVVLDKCIWEGDGVGRPLGLMRILPVNEHWRGWSSGTYYHNATAATKVRIPAVLGGYINLERDGSASFVMPSELFPRIIVPWAADGEVVVGDLARAYTVVRAPRWYARREEPLRFEDDDTLPYVKITLAGKVGGALVEPAALTRFHLAH